MENPRDEITQQRLDACRDTVRELRAEVERLKKELASSTDFVADNAVFPTEVAFANGRIVRIAETVCYRQYLEVDWAAASSGEKS